MDFVEIEILNWSKYNPRKDFKAPRWFALSNRLFEDAMFSEFSHEELVAWIYILTQASQKNSSRVQLYFKHASKVGSISKRALQSALDKLEKAKSIQLQVRDTYASVQIPNSTLHYTTLHNTTEQYIAQTEVRARLIFDFESLYKKYPRKVGKEKGLKICAVQIKTPEDFANLSLAIDRYTEHLKTNATDSKFIKHFSTFMASWRDWLDPNHGSAKSFSAAEIDWSEFTERQA